MKKKYYQFRERFFQWGAVPFLLFFLWAVLTVWYSVSLDKSFTVIAYYHNHVNFSHLSYQKLLAGSTIAGEFAGQDTNLGIVAIRFRTFIRVPYRDEDMLVFRLKEKGAKKWYYENTYRSGLIYDMPLFPFGFPKIADSKGKTYLFEITSLYGNQENAVALSQRQPILESKYQKSKSVLLHNRKELIAFLFRRLFNSLTTADSFYSSFIFSLPFLFYCLLILPFGEHLSLWWYRSPYFKMLSIRVDYLKKRLRIHASLLLILFIVVLLSIDVFYLQLASDYLYLVLPAAWLYASVLLGHKGKISFVMGVSFLIPAVIVFYLQQEILSEQIAAWGYLFVVVGVIQWVVEAMKDTK